MSFKATSQKSEKGLTLTFEGTIDELAKFDQVDVSSSTELTIDMSGVRRVNSIGIRNWMIWIGKNAKGKHMRFVQCPRAVVEQINLVQGFVPRGSDIDSVLVPYRCDPCDFDEDHLFSRAKNFPNGELQNLPSVDCPNCGKAMEMDVEPSKFFRFLKPNL